MKIGVDISQIVYQGTGVARFTQGLVNAILDYDKKNQWVFFFSSLRKKLDKELEQKIINKNHQLIKWRIPPTLLSFFWNNLHQFSQLITKKYLNIDNLDWFISSDWIEPPLSKNIKKATIVHDLVYLRYPETVDKKILKTQQQRLKWVKKESDIIFTDSESTKNDLINFLKIDKNKIVVNYPGLNVTIPSKIQIEKTLKKYQLDNQKFVLTVGKIEPRKNFNRLIKAFCQLNQSLRLIIVGPKGWDNDQLTILNNQQSKIKYLSYINDLELYSLYSSCLCFIFPSIWEGFGYPIIEAMQLKTPVICSNILPLKEIAGDAALFFDPLSVKEMSKTINKLINNKTLRNQLIIKGLRRSRFFCWKNYYNNLIKSLSLN